MKNIKFRTTCAVVVFILAATFLLILNFEREAQLLITNFNSPAQRQALKEARSGNKEFSYIEKAVSNYQEHPTAENLQDIKTQFESFSKLLSAYKNNRYYELTSDNPVFAKNLLLLSGWQEATAINLANTADIVKLDKSMDQIAPFLRKLVAAIDDKNNDLLEIKKDRFSDLIKSRVMLNSFLFCTMIGFALLALRTIWRNEKTLIQLKEAERQALAASDAKSLFLASISHEMRTPLTTILGYTELIKNTGLLPPLEDQYLGHAIHASLHLQHLLGNVLDMSKIEAGHLSLNEANICINTLISDLEAMFRPLARQKGLNLSIEMSTPVPPCLFFDGGKWRQILVNLLSNAIKFTDSGSIKLRFSMHKDEQEKLYLKAVVQDPGMGISAEESSLIFKPFIQTQSGLHKGGTGLGLLLSKTYACHMGGDLTFISTPGKGSEFTAIVSVNLGEMHDLHSSAQHADLARLHILLIEDQAVNRELMRNILSGAGAEITEAANGRIALQLLTDHADINAIIIDRNMPELDGMQTIEAMLKRGIFLPTLMVSAGLRPSDEQMQQLGIKAWLSKPFNSFDLINSIAMLCHHRELVNSPSALPPVIKTENHLLFNPAANERLGFSHERFLVLAQKGLARIYEIVQQLKPEDDSQNGSLAHGGRGIALQIGAEQLAGALNQIESSQGRLNLMQLNELSAILNQTRAAITHYRDTSTLNTP
ncbi:MAG: ATP-binding protein [Iodobacter sp.]